MDEPLYCTVNYLFAAYLQTKEAGEKRMIRFEKVRAGKAKFFFELSDKEAERLKLQFHHSICFEFERLRKATIDLSY